MLKSLRKLLVLATLLALLPALPPAAAQSENVLRIGMVQQPNTLDPLLQTQFSENYIDEALFSSLTVLDDRGNVTPDLAVRVPTRENGGISRDGRTITYHLRPNVKWHDGVPLTADDVVFTFEKMRDPKTGFAALSSYDPVESVTAPNPLTVVIRLKDAWADAVGELFVNGQFASIVPRHILEKSTDLKTDPFGGHPIGTGPYVFKSWARDGELVLDANPNYFRGKPAIAQLRMQFVPESETLAIKLRTGELDFVPGVGAATLPTIVQNHNLRIIESPTESLNFLTYRTDTGLFADPALRRAFSDVIDRDAIVKKAYLGHAQPAAEFEPPWSRFATLKTPPRRDLAGARATLDRDGWRVGSDGIRVKNGTRLHAVLTTVAGSRPGAVTAVMLQAAWRSIGADVEIRPVQVNILYAPGTGIAARGDFDVMLQGEGFSAGPDRGNDLLSASIPPNGVNFARYRNDDVDRAVTLERATLDFTARKRAFALIAHRLATDEPYVPLAWAKRIAVLVKTLHGFRPETVNSDFWNVYAWQLR